MGNLDYKHLAEQLGAELPTYGVYVQAEIDLLKPGTRRSQALPSVERLAELYLQQIRPVQPVGPYQLLGYSFGGLVAFKLARQLHAAGEGVHLLALLDSFAPGSRRPASLRGWVHHTRTALRVRWPSWLHTKA